MNEAKHIAMIMDGNGRWAESRGLERVQGHAEGARSVGSGRDDEDRFALELPQKVSLKSWQLPVIGSLIMASVKLQKVQFD